jgi:predicted anti-sigma-YlaC factor YlaD
MDMRPVRPLVCERVRGQISVGLDGELSQLERVMIASHLERCAACGAYEAEVRAFTHALREAPLEPMTRSVVIHRRRRHVGARLQVAAAAAVALAALVGAGEALRGQQLNIESPSFVPDAAAAHIKYMTRQQVEREQAILARAPRPGHPVQLDGEAL